MEPTAEKIKKIAKNDLKEDQGRVLIDFVKKEIYNLISIGNFTLGVS